MPDQSPATPPANNSGSTEFAFAKLNSIVAIVMMFAGALFEGLTQLGAQTTLPHWVGLVMIGLGTILKLGTFLGYNAGRANVKAMAAQPPRGFVRVRTLLTTTAITAFLLAVLMLGFAAVARADDSAPPPLGGCNKALTVCWGPTTSISVVAYSLSTGQFSAGLIPGAGYGVTLWRNTSYALGLGGYASLKTTGTGPTTGLFSVIASFNNYLRFGFARQIFNTEHENLLVLGLGMDLK